LILELVSDLPLTLVTPTAIGQIIDDNEYATVKIADDPSLVLETNLKLVFDIILSNNFQAVLNPTRTTIRQSASVYAETVDGTATAGTDYEARGEIIRYNLNNIEQPADYRFGVNIMADQDLTGGRTDFLVVISAPEPLGLLTIAKDRALGNIQDPARAYQLTVKDATGMEGTNLDFIVNMSPVQTFDVKFTIQLDGCQDWTDCQGKAIGRPPRSTRQEYGDFAREIIDYTLPASTMSIPAGSSRTVFSVFANDDTIVEPHSEVFTVSLVSYENPVAFPTATATGTIYDNDDDSVLSVLSQDVTTPEASQISFPFQLSNLVEANILWSAGRQASSTAVVGVDVASRAVNPRVANFECTAISPKSQCFADLQLLVKDFIDVAGGGAPKVLSMVVNFIQVGDELTFPNRSTWTKDIMNAAVRCDQPNFEANISQTMGIAEIYVEDMTVSESAGRITFPVRSTHMSTVAVTVNLHIEGMLLVAPYAGSFLWLDYKTDPTQCGPIAMRPNPNEAGVSFCAVDIPALCNSAAVPPCGTSVVDDAYVDLNIDIVDDVLSEHLYEFVEVSLETVQYPNYFRIPLAKQTATLTITDNDDVTISISSAQAEESVDVLNFNLAFDKLVDVDVVVDYVLEGCEADNLANNPACAYGSSDNSSIVIGAETIYPDFFNGTSSFLATRLETDFLIPVPLYDNDLQVECDETFRIALTQAEAINVTSEAQYRVGNAMNTDPVSVIGTIKSSSRSLEVYFTSNETGIEGDRLTFQVSASKSSSTPFTIMPSLTYGDYSQGRVDNVNSPVTFPAGSMSSSFNISLIVDSFANPTGQFLLSFPANAQILVPDVQNCVYQNSDTAPSSSGRGEVLNGVPPVISVLPSQATKGNPVIVTITLDSALQNLTVTVPWSVAGVANAAGSVVFNSQPNLDNPLQIESDEFLTDACGTFTIELGTPISDKPIELSVSQRTAIATVLCDDSTLSVVNSGSDTVVAGAPAQFKVTHSQTIDSVVTFDYKTFESTAKASVDFESRVDTAVIDANTNSTTFTITTFQIDDAVSLDKTFLFGISNGTRTDNTSVPCVGTIVEGYCVAEATITDPTTATIGFKNLTFESNEGGSLDFIITLSLKVPISFTATVNVAGVTAEAGVDYDSPSSEVPFAPEQMTATLAVTLLENGIVDGAKTMLATILSTSTDLVNVVGQPNATGIIIDNDFAIIGFSSDAVITAGFARFTVSMTAPVPVPVKVNFKTVDQTARQGEQYEAFDGIVTFAANQTSIDVDVVLIPMGSTVYPTMTFGAILSNADSTAVVSLATIKAASATILKANTAGFVLEPQPTKVLAGSPVVLQVSTVNNITGLNAIEMLLSTKDVTAKSGVDFVQPSGKVEWIADSNRFIMEGSLSSYLVVQTTVPTNDNLFGETDVTFVIQVDGFTFQPSSSQIDITSNSFFKTNITIVKSSGNYGIPFTSRCLAPLRWGSDNSVAELRLDATENPIAGEGWLISKTVYLEDCFAGFDQQNAADLTFRADCTTTNTTMSVTLDTTNPSRPVSVLVFNAETIAANAAAPFAEYIVIVQPILNSLALQPITIKVKWRSPVKNNYKMSNLALTKKRTRVFEMGTTWFATIEEIPARFIRRNADSPTCTKYNEGGQFVEEKSGACCSFRGGQSIASFKQCFQYNNGRSVNNQKQMQVQLQSLSAGQAQACVGIFIDQPQEQCWNILIPEPLTILRIPVQYVVPDGDNNWEVKVPVSVLGSASLTATITTESAESGSDITSQYSDGILTVSGTNPDAAMHHVKIMATSSKSVHTGEFVFITVLA